MQKRLYFVNRQTKELLAAKASPFVVAMMRAEGFERISLKDYRRFKRLKNLTPS